MVRALAWNLTGVWFDSHPNLIFQSDVDVQNNNNNNNLLENIVSCIQTITAQHGSFLRSREMVYPSKFFFQMFTFIKLLIIIMRSTDVKCLSADGNTFG